MHFINPIHGFFLRTVLSLSRRLRTSNATSRTAPQSYILL